MDIWLHSGTMGSCTSTSCCVFHLPFLLATQQSALTLPFLSGLGFSSLFVGVCLTFASLLLNVISQSAMSWEVCHKQLRSLHGGVRGLFSSGSEQWVIPTPNT